MLRRACPKATRRSSSCGGPVGPPAGRGAARSGGVVIDWARIPPALVDAAMDELAAALKS